MAEFYGISSLDEARAYLAHPLLGPRLILCTETVLALQGRSLHAIFGSPDDLKFCSSMTLFSLAAGEGEGVFRGLDPTLLPKALAIRDWLLTEAAQLADPGQISPGLAERLIALGIPIDRIMSAIDLLHSEYAGIGRFWTKEEGTTSRLFPHGPDARSVSTTRARSPTFTAPGNGCFSTSRKPLTSRFNIIPDLKAAGYRHYLVVPIFFTNGNPPRPDLCDPRPGGIWRAGLAGSAVCDADDCGHDGDPRPPSPPRQRAAHLRRR